MQRLSFNQRPIKIEYDRANHAEVLSHATELWIVSVVVARVA